MTTRKHTDTRDAAEDQRRLASGAPVQLLHETAEQGPLSFLVIAEVMQRTTYSQSGIYALMSRKDDPFPPPYRLSANRVAWLESEVDGWLRARIAKGPSLPEGNLTKLTKEAVEVRQRKALEAKARKRKERAA